MFLVMCKLFLVDNIQYYTKFGHASIFLVFFFVSVMMDSTLYSIIVN